MCVGYTLAMVVIAVVIMQLNVVAPCSVVFGIRGQDCFSDAGVLVLVALVLPVVRRDDDDGPTSLLLLTTYAGTW